MTDYHISSSVPDFVLQEVADRLSQCELYTAHDPLCLCDDVTKCLNVVKCRNPTEFAMLPLKNFSEISQNLYKQKLLKLLNPSKPKVDNTFVFLTISPAPDILFPDFLKKFLKFLNTSLFEDYCAVIEQRGNTPDTLGIGFHAHILFKRRTPLTEGLPPTDIKRKLRDIWRKFTMVTNPQVFNIQFIPSNYAEDKLNYILSTKTGKGKKQKQDFDILFREKHSLQSHYGNKNLLM